MKNIKGILTFVFVVVILLVVGVMSYQALVAAPRAAEEKSILKQYNFPDNTVGSKTPSTGFSTANSTTDVQDPDINTLLQDLDETVDNDATSDLLELETQTEGL